MIKYYRFLLLLLVFLLSCESDNEHFCARYQYVYNQLLDDDLPSYGEMRQELLAKLADPTKDQDQARFMLFALEDWYSEIKPLQEGSREFCLRVQRWKYYP